jgi:hypothetical protein
MKKKSFYGQNVFSRRRLQLIMAVEIKCYISDTYFTDPYLGKGRRDSLRLCLVDREEVYDSTGPNGTIKTSRWRETGILNLSSVEA